MTVYILSHARTPSGSFLGSLSSVPAPELGAQAIKGSLDRIGMGREKIDEVFMGNVIQTGVGQAPARQASLGAGLLESVPATTINKVCGSGLKAIIMGAQTILAGDNEVVLAGGMENMSLSPHYIPGSRKGVKFGETPLRDSLQNDGLTDAYTGLPMGNCAEECARKYNLTREEQDAFAIESFKRAQRAIEGGFFESEITPVTVRGRKGDTLVERDEGPFLANFEKIPKLRGAFAKEGTITAANASTLNDGAAAVILGGDSSRDQASFKIISYAKHAQNPTWFTTAPIEAMRKCAEKGGIQLYDIDLFEINEAFSVVPLVVMKELELPRERVNIYGGGVSLGHPIGCSGARIVVTLMNALQREKGRYGMASICIGGGEALALLIERL